MLILNFEGYFQMRMATDPDPTDDKRGVSGYTFALAGEPDLDAKIHLQPDEEGVWERDFGPRGGPKVGVKVTKAMRDGVPDSDLVGTRVAFIDAQILEHNGLLVRNDYFIIHPFRVRLLKADSNDILLERVDWLNPDNPAMPENDATATQLARRQAKKFTGNSEEVAKATGLESPANVALIANRLERRKSLQALLEQTTDPIQIAALESRIYQLAIVERWWELSVNVGQNKVIDRRAAQLALQLDGWNVDMNGEVAVNELHAAENYPWNISFWMGGWDGDALCGYVKGTWTIPLAENVSWSGGLQPAER
ncbi:MAG TPA: hypothetical protein VKB93_25990 [Thermoanaerobaculia bacterium]|nr:hypothetical protein [Thermoanaerobaculia bacterium]